VSHELCTVSLSKSLRPFHEKALYRYLNFDSFPRFKELAETVAGNPSKAALTRGCSVVIDFTPDASESDLVRRVLVGLSPGRLEIGQSAPPDVFFHTGTHYAHFSTLHTLIFAGVRSDSVVSGIQQIPSLRNVELIDVHFVSRSPSKPTAHQVTTMALVSQASRSYTFGTSSLLPHFPSAAIVKLDLLCLHETEYESIRSILTQLTPALRILRLEVRLRGGYVSTEPIDDLLPLFPFLRELHLGDRFLSNDIHEHLLVLHHLVELSLVLEDMSPEFVHLLKGPQRLRHLQKLVLQFVPLKPGECLDIDYAAMEMEHNHCDEDGKGVMFLRMCDEVSDMFYGNCSLALSSSTEWM